MKRSFYSNCICGIILLGIFTNNSHSPQPRDVEEQRMNNFTDLKDTVWSLNPIAKLKESAPGGGTFEEFGDHYFLESGAFVFWARFGDNKRKDWALYSYNNGSTKFILKAFEKHSEPDGVPKEFFRSINSMTNPALAIGQERIHYGGGSSKLLYIVGAPGGLGRINHICSWNGEQLKKVISEGDKIALSGNREVIIKVVQLQGITNDNQALIFFTSEKPNKVTGWLLHDGTNLKPFLISGDEIPGLPGIKLKGLVINGTFHDKIFIFNDTILVNLFVDNGPTGQSIFRISKSGTELIEPQKGLNPIALPHAENGNNFIIKSKDIIHYKNGNRKFILENKRDLPKKEQFLDYNIFAYGITGPEKESIVFAVAGDKTRLFCYHDNKLSLLNVDTKSPIDVSMSPLLTESMINQAEWAQIKTTGTERFDITDIIDASNKNKMLVKYTPFFGVAGFFELTK